MKTRFLFTLLSAVLCSVSVFAQDDFITVDWKELKSTVARNPQEVTDKVEIVLALDPDSSLPFEDMVVAFYGQSLLTNDREEPYVYIGGSRFGARAYADNLDEQRMLEAIDYMHLHGKRLYLTVNTLLKERELKKDLYSYLLPYYREGLDAVIVQDFGVLSCIREWFPDLAVHASTQMTVTGAEGAALLEELGVVRVVPARELSLQEIASIREHTNLEIETFVHGALCYCYSGQCLFSSILGGRSGNRGRCAQPCRLPYEVYESGRRLNGRDSQYVLSPKDMCTVELLPQIVFLTSCLLKFLVYVNNGTKELEY